MMAAAGIAFQLTSPSRSLFSHISNLSPSKRPDIGAYGEPHMSTPNLDKLASSSLLFGNAYCQQAVCSPSRMCVQPSQTATPTTIFSPCSAHNRCLLLISLQVLYHGPSANVNQGLELFEVCFSWMAVD